MLVGLCVSVTTVFAADKRESQLKELAVIKAELKPLREKAYLEPEVIASRRKLDEAYTAYWESVRVAMLRLDPSKKSLIEKDMALRKEVAPVSAGSRAADYEKKAAENTAKKSP